MPRNVYVCGPAAKAIRLIYLKAIGKEMDAVTVGNVIVIFEPKPEGENWMRLQRHEAMHVEQQARMAPSWARWLPRAARVWMGAPRFMREYFAEWKLHGYENNKFEIEARAAE